MASIIASVTMLTTKARTTRANKMHILWNVPSFVYPKWLHPDGHFLRKHHLHQMLQTAKVHSNENVQHSQLGY